MGRKLFRRFLGILICAFLLVGSSSSALNQAAAQPKGPILLANFPVHQQETPYTCGPAAARMVLEFLGHPMPEKDLAQAMKTNRLVGTSNGMMARGLNQYLDQTGTGLQAKIIKGKAATDQAVADSLRQGYPVIATFLTENFFKPGTPVGHFCVIIGIDPAKKQFTIANPFGYIETMDIDRFWRLAQWRPVAGDIPGVQFSKLRPYQTFCLPRNLAMLSEKGN